MWERRRKKEICDSKMDDEDGGHYFSDVGWWKRRRDEDESAVREIKDGDGNVQRRKRSPLFRRLLQTNYPPRLALLVRGRSELPQRDLGDLESARSAAASPPTSESTSKLLQLLLQVRLSRDEDANGDDIDDLGQLRVGLNLFDAFEVIVNVDAFEGRPTLSLPFLVCHRFGFRRFGRLLPAQQHERVFPRDCADDVGRKCSALRGLFPIGRCLQYQPNPKILFRRVGLLWERHSGQDHVRGLYKGHCGSRPRSGGSGRGQERECGRESPDAPRNGREKSRFLRSKYISITLNSYFLFRLCRFLYVPIYVFCLPPLLLCTTKKKSRVKAKLDHDMSGQIKGKVPFFGLVAALFYFEGQR